MKNFVEKIRQRMSLRSSSLSSVPRSLFPSLPSSLKSGFTLIELLVVIAMLSILIGAVGSGVAQARKRAKIARATQDAKEITNAILGFRNYAKNRSLTEYDTGGWKDATEGNLKMILGGENSESGERVPVLYNAQLQKGEVRDPWGKAYRFTIRKMAGGESRESSVQYLRAPNLPNFYRLTDAERQ